MFYLFTLVLKLLNAQTFLSKTYDKKVCAIFTNDEKVCALFVNDKKICALFLQ